MTGISVSVNDAQAKRLLARVGERMEDMRDLMELIGMSMAERTRLQFVQQADPWGRAWEPLSPLTQMLRREGPGGGSNKILRDTSRLMNSIAYKAESKRVAVGTNVIYGAIHQMGGTIYPKRSRYLWAGREGGKRVPLSVARIPARPYLPIRKDRADLPQTWRDDLIQTIKDWLEEPL